MIVADYCTVMQIPGWSCPTGTGWVSVLYIPKEASAKQLITIVRVICTTFWIAENVTTDDGSQFRANKVGSRPQVITHTQILWMKRVSRLLRCY